MFNKYLPLISLSHVVGATEQKPYGVKYFINISYIFGK